MITRALNLRRSGSRRPRPSRFPVPGFPRGASMPSHRRAFLSARTTRHVKIGGVGADLVAALVMVGGIFLWGGLLILLAA